MTLYRYISKRICPWRMNISSHWNEQISDPENLSMGDPFGVFQSSNSVNSGVTCGCLRQTDCCTPKSRPVHRNRFNSPSHHINEFSPGSTPCSKLVTYSSDGVHSTSSPKQVYLFKWFLIRVVKDCPENGIIDDGVQIAVGGYRTSDLLGSPKFRTAPIESRIEKCKLRTVDGLDVLLMGTIDDQYTYDNGFPFQVIHLFMHGFPFNWNHIVNICKGRPSSNIAPLPVSKIEEYVSKECPVVQVDDTGTGKLSSLEPEEHISKVVSRRESSVRCSKRVRRESQLSRSSKGSKCGKLSTESKPKLHFTCVESQENYNISKESEANMCLDASNKSIEKERSVPCLRSSDKDIYVQIKQEDKSTVLGSELGKTKPLNFSVSQTVKKPVENENKIMKGYYLQRAKTTEEFKKQIDSGTSLEAKLITATINIEDSNENITSDRFTESATDAHHRLDIPEVEQSLLNNEHLDQSKDICSPLEEQTQVIQIPISEFADSCYKMRRGRVSGKSNTKKNKSRNAFSQASSDLLCDDAIVKDAIESNSDGKDMTYGKESHQEIIPTRRLHEVSKAYSQFPLDSDFLEFGSKNTRIGTDGKAHTEEDNSADVGIIELQKNVSIHSSQTKSFPPGNSHINNDVIKSEKDVKLNKSRTKRQGRDKRTTRHTIPAVLEGLVCSEKMVKDDVNLKFDDLDSTSNGDPHLVACEIDNDMPAEHNTEIGDNCLKENIDRDNDSLQTEKHGTLKITGTPTSKRQHSHAIIPPPLPRRVQITPEVVSKAFGLKTSRSGRLLVPPLAHWCNQKIAYDLDGSIIAIFDGISEEKEYNGGSNFKPPTEVEAKRMQRKLCKVANEVIKTPKSGKKIRKG